VTAFEAVRVHEPRTGPATAATHRSIWGACAAGAAWVAFELCGVAHPVLAACAVGLLTLLPRIGPALGAALAGLLAAFATPMFGAFIGAATAIGVALVGLPAQHLPRWLGPLSPGAVAASALVGGAYRSLPGAIGALLLAATVAGIVRRLTPRA
jgi:hypothetical protein